MFDEKWSRKRMALKMIVSLLDDLDGGKADRTIKFSVDGTDHEIDLNHANSERLTQALKPFIEKARKLKLSTRISSSGDTAQIRPWAREQGIAISDRGRIRAEVRELYRNRK